MENLRNQGEWRGKSFHRIAQVLFIAFHWGSSWSLRYHLGRCLLTNWSFEGHSTGHPAKMLKFVSKIPAVLTQWREALILVCLHILCRRWGLILAHPSASLWFWVTQNPGHSLCFTPEGQDFHCKVAVSKVSCRTTIRGHPEHSQRFQILYIFCFVLFLGWTHFCVQVKKK